MTDEVQNMTPQERAAFITQFVGEHMNQFVSLGMTTDDILAGVFNFLGSGMAECYGREHTADWLEAMADRIRECGELDFQPPTAH